MHFRIHRAYEKPDAGDGIRILLGTVPSPSHERCTPAHYAPRYNYSIWTVGCDVAAKELCEQNRGS